MQRVQKTYTVKADRTRSHPSFKKKYNTPTTLDPDESEIDYEQLITEDDEPVDNLFSERQQKLLTDSLYTSWDTDKLFLACANVGIYEKIPKKPIVPDVFLSLGVKPAKDIWKKKNRCYMIGVFGKPPELAIEIVSNTIGKERKEKLKKYERMDIKYYVIYDPDLRIFKSKLHAYELKSGKYVAFPRKEINKRIWFSDLEIGLRLYNGSYQKMDTEWLIWCDDQGNVLKTSEEKALFEQNRAKDAEIRAEDAEKELLLLKTKFGLI
ncbi:MAG: Uma2 family endonuclease [Candidatus Magnetomorum sp.]|nr:Uma2 family endonuclease [Candidatus Magnetomorum sp.]